MRIGLEVNLDENLRFEEERCYRKEPDNPHVRYLVIKRGGEGIYDEGPRTLASFFNMLPKLSSITIGSKNEFDPQRKEYFKQYLGDEDALEHVMNILFHFSFFVRTLGLANANFVLEELLAKTGDVRPSSFELYYDEDAGSTKVLASIRKLQIDSGYDRNLTNPVVELVLEKMPNLECLNLGSHILSIENRLFYWESLSSLSVTDSDIEDLTNTCTRHAKTLKELAITSGSFSDTSFRHSLATMRANFGDSLERFTVGGDILRYPTGICKGRIFQFSTVPDEACFWHRYYEPQQWNGIDKNLDATEKAEMSRLVEAFVLKKIDQYPEHEGLLETGDEFTSGVVP